LEQSSLATSELTRVEAIRAIRLVHPSALPGLVPALSIHAVIYLDGRILDAAASMDPPRLRTLDAIHLATAMSLGARLEGVVTYDARMAAAARELGLRVESPGS